MAKVAMMTDGLKRRQTYEEVIDYIENDNDKIRYPDRTAKQLRNTFELSQLDGVGMQLMEQQQFREMKEREKEHLLRQIASNTSKSITEARATQTEETEQSQEGQSGFHTPQSQEGQSGFHTPPSTIQLELSPQRQFPPWVNAFIQGVFGRTQHFNIASDYDEREQERRDTEEAADVSLDMSRERELLKQEDARIMHQTALQSIHQAHQIHRSIPNFTPIEYQQLQMLMRGLSPTSSPSSTTSSFIRELEAQFQSPPRTPPRTQQLALPPPMPVPGRPGSSSDGAIVPVSNSPITVNESPPRHTKKRINKNEEKRGLTAEKFYNEKELRKIAAEVKLHGRSKMKKQELYDNLRRLEYVL